ncbi:MAG TPA: hypothetical protein VFU63_07000 [Ktedonobacterales bacterium]|nr:hypothetical protein [Ktedonobacterales bacterium]
MPMQYFFPGMNGTGMFVWMIISTVFWLGLAAVAVWALVRLATRASRGAGMGSPTASQPTVGQPTAADILKQRYARGEIDADTFREMMAHLAAADEAATPAKSV